MRVVRIVAVVIWALAWAALASAQATSDKSLAWDQGAASVAEAQALTFRYYADGAAVGVVLPGVTCAGAMAPFVCSAPFPAFTPGTHTLALTAANVAGESAKSALLSFTFVVVPAVPAALRIQ